MLLCIVVRDEHKTYRHDETGDNTAHEHLADVISGSVGENDHHNARGNDRAERACGRDNGDSEAFFVSVVHERGNHQGADRGRIRVAGTGNTGHYDAGHGRRVRDAAADMPDYALGKVDEFLGYTGLLHDLSCHHEERDRHIGEAVRGTVYLTGKNKVRYRRISQQPDDACTGKTHGNRSTDKKHDKEYQDRYT